MFFEGIRYYSYLSFCVCVHLSIHVRNRGPSTMSVLILRPPSRTGGLKHFAALHAVPAPRILSSRSSMIGNESKSGVHLPKGSMQICGVYICSIYINMYARTYVHMYVCVYVYVVYVYMIICVCRCISI